MSAYRATHIQTEIGQGKRHRMCWLPIDRRVKPGIWLTIDGLPGEWRVIKQYERIDARFIFSSREYRVGGL